ncbi:MAG: hypothetical protein RIB63_18490 [Fulvivirga sp.]
MKTKRPNQEIQYRPDISEESITALKATISLIPVAGSAINEVLFERPSRIHQKRVNQTVDILKEKFSQLESKLNKSYLKTDSFFDLTKAVFQETIKTSSEEKRKALAAIYINAVQNEASFETSRSGLFMKFVVDLSLVQIQILRHIKEYEKFLYKVGSYTDFFKIFSGANLNLILDPYEFKYFCNDLENKGLIGMGAGLDDYNDMSSLSAYADHEEASVNITEFGHEFLSFLKG